MGIIPILNNTQLDELERSKAPVLPKQEPPKMTELAGYVRTCWQRAYDHKNAVQTQLLKNLRAFNQEYPPEDLAAIRSLGGSEQFIALSSTKSIAAIAWLDDIFDQPSVPPWDIDPTPYPVLPAEMEEQIRMLVMQEALQIIGAYAQITGQDPNFILQLVLPDIRKRVRNKIKEKAIEGIDELKIIMDDQLVEGGWYAAFKQCLFDLVVYKAAILKGPIFRKRRQFRRVENMFGGGFVNQIEDVVIPVYERRSPFNIYPSPDSTGSQDGYLCDLDSLSLKALYQLIGVEGFNEVAIRRVLDQYKTGGLREWATMNTEQLRLESGGQKSTFDTDKVDVVEFWGDVPGSMLLAEGLSVDEIADPQKRYDVCVWLVGNEVIKAMLNPNPMGRKPYTVRSYVTIPGSFWGRGLPELITDLQQICNAITRAIINNAALSSGPLVEVDTDRVPGMSTGIYPWKHIESTDSKMAGSPAVRFYQPQITADTLSRVLQVFIQLADQYSVPSYAHGDINIAGSGETASGLSMLMSSANRVVKKVVKNADDMIKESVEMLFYYNIYYNSQSLSFVGDINIVAKGVNSMLQKEQQAVRRQEFLAATNNEIDFSIMGAAGRRELLREVAGGIDIDKLSKIFPEIDQIDGLRSELEAIVQQQQAAAQESMLRQEQKEEKMEMEEHKAKVKADNTPSKPKKLTAGGQEAGGPDRSTSQKANEPKRV